MSQISPAEPTSMVVMKLGCIYMAIHCIGRCLSTLYIYDERWIQSEEVLGLAHVIVVVVYFVPSCYPDLATSAQTYGIDEGRMHPYGHPLHQKVLKHFIYIRCKCNPVWSGSWPCWFHSCSGMVCTHLLPRFSQLSPHPWLIWSKDASKWPSTASEGASTL